MKQSLGAAIAVALALAGCGSGGTKTVTVTSTSSSTSSTSFSFSTTTPSGSASSTAAATTPLNTTATTSTAAATVSLATFKSPTGNIGCMIVAGTVRCDIQQRKWSPPPRPASCPNIVDFGQGLIVGRFGAARFVCAGDTSRDPSAKALAYNTATLVDGFRCQSAFNGMTCTYTGTGHGFFISIQGYRVF